VRIGRSVRFRALALDCAATHPFPPASSSIGDEHGPGGDEAEGYSVDWVRDGGEAETALLNGGHALALLDLGLPGAAGWPASWRAARASRTA
jgi:hypothetical protein